MEQEVVARRAALLSEAGVIFHGGQVLGGNLAFADLQARHDAVVLAYGYRARRLDLPDEDLAGAIPAMEYLVSSSRALIGETAAPGIHAAGKWVVVIGGGDTAMDCVRTAVRQGADGVTCLYRRNRANMPGSAREVGHAEEEGAKFSWQSQPEALSDVPVEVIASRPEGFGQRGAVRTVRACRTQLGAPDHVGRKRPEPVPASNRRIRMRLTMMSDYALRVLLYAAAHPNRLMTIDETQEIYDMSRGHLMKIVGVLATAGILRSQRGRAGGSRWESLPKTFAWATSCA